MKTGDIMILHCCFGSIYGFYVASQRNHKTVVLFYGNQFCLGFPHHKNTHLLSRGESKKKKKKGYKVALFLFVTILF